MPRRRKAQTWEEREKEAVKVARKEVIREAVIELNKRRAKSPDGRVPDGTLQAIKAMFGNPDFMTNSAIYNEQARILKKSPEILGVSSSPSKASVPKHVEGDSETISVHSSVSNPTAQSKSDDPCKELLLDSTQPTEPGKSNKKESGNTKRTKDGRPLFSTIEEKEAYKQKLAAATRQATIQYKAERAAAKGKDEVLPVGRLDAIILSNVMSQGLSGADAAQIKKSTIRSRDHRNGDVNGITSSNLSPMSKVEDTLVQFCIQLTRIARSIDKHEFLQLAQSIVKGTAIEKEFEEWKKIRHYPQTEGLVGTGYYKRFTLRHSKDKNLVWTKRGFGKDANRSEWATYDYVEKMYDSVYQRLLEAGIAIELDEPRHIDATGKEVTEKEAFGLPVKYRLTHPDYFVIVDEIGRSANPKRGRKRRMAEKDSEADEEAMAADRSYTILGLTAANGQPVMCALIFKTEAKDVPANWSRGIDVFRLPEAIQDSSYLEYLGRQFAEDGCFAGGPACYFRGKNVPCFIGSSPHGRTTPQLLVAMLRTMDELELFPRTDGKLPFLLLDGQQSIGHVDFLSYVRDDRHKWVTCVGVPYGTGHDGDSLEHQHRSYRMYEAEAKAMIIDKKTQLLMDNRPTMTDVVPMVRMAWDKSFALVESNQKSCAAMGWNPCNRALLLQKEVLSTKVEENDKNGPYSISAVTAIHDPEKTKRIERLRRKKEKVFKILEEKVDERALTIKELQALCVYKKRKGDPSIATSEGDNQREVLLDWWRQRKRRESPSASDEDDQDDDDAMVTDREGDDGNVVDHGKSCGLAEI